MNTRKFKQTDTFKNVEPVKTIGLSVDSDSSGGFCICPKCFHLVFDELLTGICPCCQTRFCPSCVAKKRPV